jgi:hypothetical protein
LDFDAAGEPVSRKRTAGGQQGAHMKLALEHELRCLAIAGEPPRRVRESEFMRAVIRVAEALGWAVQIVAELKRSKKEKPTAEQLAWLARYRAAGVPVFVWTPEVWSDVERILKHGPGVGEGLQAA